MYSEVYKWTTAKERKEVAARHNVKSRQQISKILKEERINVPLLEELVALAETNKAKAEDLKTRAAALKQ